MLVLNLIHVCEGQLLRVEFRALSLYQEKKWVREEVIPDVAKFEYRCTNNERALPGKGFSRGNREI